MEKLYSAKDIERLFGLRAARIRYWDRIGFLTPSLKIGARKYYTSQDLVGLRTAKGLLDGGLSLAEVKRKVIDVKKISSGVMKPRPQFIIHGDGKGGILQSGGICLNPGEQSLIGFAHGDFVMGITSATEPGQWDCKAEPEGDGTVRGHHPGKRGSIKPKNP